MMLPEWTHRDRTLPFRYVVICDLGVFDYGSVVRLRPGEKFTVDSIPPIPKRLVTLMLEPPK
jgi:hypothetical protein